jgi:hypothetical protein
VKEDDCLSLKETDVDLPTQPGTLSPTSPSYSNPEVSCKTGSPILWIMGFQGSVNWGLREGEGMLEEDTEAPDSDEAERTGGCSKEWAAELGEP